MVHWVNPLRVPSHRRIETLCTTIIVILPLFLIFFCNLIFIAIPLLWPLYLGVIMWVYIDRNTPKRGGRVLSIVRKMPIWKPFRSYFPAKVELMEPLDPSQQYIFGVHPHGIICISIWANFMNDYSEANTLLKGIKTRIGVLGMQFKIPFFRDFALGAGVIDVSRPSLIHAIKSGISPMIIIGGAQEALDAHPGKSDIVLLRRKGFVKLALETGCNLVPIYCFGENDLFVQYPNERGSKIRGYQEYFKNMLGFSMPIFHGRGIWNYDFGLLPYRTPLLTVLGKPIKVPKIPNPSVEEVNKYHQLYMEGLKELHREYKNKFGNKEEEMRFVE